MYENWSVEAIVYYYYYYSYYYYYYYYYYYHVYFILFLYCFEDLVLEIPCLNFTLTCIAKNAWR